MPKKIDCDRFRDFMRELEPEEVKQLRANIEADGQIIKSVVVWNDRGKLYAVDGIHRCEIGEELGFKIPVIEMEFDDEAAALEWMYQHEQGQRHTDASARALLAEKARLAIANRPNREDSGAGTNVPSISEHAELTGVSKPDAVAAAKVMEHGSEKLQKMVATGEVNIRKAATIATKVPKREQAKAITEGLQEQDAPILDGLGNPAPRALRKVFETRGAFESALNTLRNLSAQLNVIAGNPQENADPLPGGEYLARDRGDLFKCVEQVRFYLKDLMPHTPCSCGKDEKCRACKGLGYVTKPMYDKAKKSERN